MKSQRNGVTRFDPRSTILASSDGLGWPSLKAEVRSHTPGEKPSTIPPTVEIVLTIAGDPKTLVRLTVDGEVHEGNAATGTIWLSPAGVRKQTTIIGPIPRTLHLYLPTSIFDPLKDDFNLPATLDRSMRHAALMGDSVIDEVGRSILAELGRETSVSRMYVETAGLTLAARLLQKYCDSGACKPNDVWHQLKNDRLRRVLDYIDANIEQDITLVKLAGIAAYSPFHFARTFKLATGDSPQRYISRLRLEKAMIELALGKLPLAEIALKANFSSQSAFTRAFHRATGLTPTEYRLRRA
jgi:AraC family transcriptional regulator